MSDEKLLVAWDMIQRGEGSFAERETLILRAQIDLVNSVKEFVAGKEFRILTPQETRQTYLLSMKYGNRWASVTHVSFYSNLALEIEVLRLDEKGPLVDQIFRTRFPLCLFDLKNPRPIGSGLKDPNTPDKAR